MNNVFGVYGIEVNSRHLSLTADYMTFTGVVQPFSRGAMAQSASPFQKMTFETTVAFMRDCVIGGKFFVFWGPHIFLKEKKTAFEVIKEKRDLFSPENLLFSFLNATKKIAAEIFLLLEKETFLISWRHTTQINKKKLYLTTRLDLIRLVGHLL